MALIKISTSDNVQAKIDSSANGDTIEFQAGTFKISDVRLRGSRTYTGVSGAEIESNSRYSFKLYGDNITIKSMTFLGPALGAFDKFDADGRVNGLQVTGNRFKGRKGIGPADGVIQWACIGWNTGLMDSLIHNNVFDPVVNWTALYGYGWRNLTVTRNTFLNRRDNSNNTKYDQGRFIKLHGVGAQKDNTSPNPYPEGNPNMGLYGVCERLRVANNYFGNFFGMAIEYQDGSADDIFEENMVEKPIFISGNVQDHLDCYGFSIVAARSRNLICRRNAFYLQCTSPVDRERLAIELGGYNVTCEDNLIVGPMGAAIDMNGSNGSGVIRNNRLENAPGPKAANGAHPVMTNNGSNVTLGWLGQVSYGATWGWSGASPSPSGSSSSSSTSSSSSSSSSKSSSSSSSNSSSSSSSLSPVAREFSEVIVRAKEVIVKYNDGTQQLVKP